MAVGDGTGNGDERLRTSYEVRSGGRAVAMQTASTAQEALVDYLRALGCRDDEIVRMGSDVAVWRGAVFSVVPAVVDES
jgi:hypothetical protein